MQPTLPTFSQQEDRNTRRNPRFSERALTNSFHMCEVTLTTFSLRIEPTTKGECYDKCTIEGPIVTLFPRIFSRGYQSHLVTLFSVEKSDEPQELSAGINIQLDTGTVAKILGNIQLSAIMGFTKIQIPKAFQVRNVFP